MKILIKNVELNKQITDILISGNLISKIAENIDEKESLVIDGNNKAIIPGLMNGHTHAAMTLFRSYADDMPLREWLEKKIWPLEKKMTEEDVYWGTKLACLEMIRSGTTFFNDMYWHFNGVCRAVEEMGLRASLSSVFIDFSDNKQAEKQKELNEKLFTLSKDLPDRIMFCLGPHSPYAVSEESLNWMKYFAKKNNLLIHIHVSETENEMKDCIKKNGMRPFEYLEKIKFLGPNVIACHAIWLDDNEIDICEKYGVKIVYNPVSNLKLASGQCFKYEKMIMKNVPVLIGTDGCASNNNLSILESLKFASLIQKSNQNDPTIMSSDDAFKMATANVAHAFGIKTGEIKEGMLADLVLIDLNRPELTPNHNLYSNLIYSANASCVDTVICDGKILMKDRKVKDEEIIIENAKKRAYEMINK